MANLRYVLGGTTLIPELPVDRQEDPIAESLDMAAGNRRWYTRATRRRVTWTLRLSLADETTWAAWDAAAQGAELGATLVEPDGSSFTVKTISFSDTVSSVASVTSGAYTTSAVGTLLRDLVLTVESL